MSLHDAIMLNVSALNVKGLLMFAFSDGWCFAHVALCLLMGKVAEDGSRWEAFHFPKRQQCHTGTQVPPWDYLDAQLLKSSLALVCPMCLASCGCCCLFKWARVTPQEQNAGLHKITIFSAWTPDSTFQYSLRYNKGLCCCKFRGLWGMRVVGWGWVCCRGAGRVVK